MGGLGGLFLGATIVYLWKRKQRKNKEVEEGNFNEISMVVPKSNVKDVEIKQRLGGGNFGDVFYGVWAVRNFHEISHV